MDWKKVLKFDRAKMRRREKREEDAIDETHFSGAEKDHMSRLARLNREAEEQDHLEGRREKRKRMGLRTTQQDRIMGTAGTPRSKRVHRMKPEDRPKPRRKATKEEEEELRLRNKPPIMRNTRGQ
tara:strand:+ start:144 stop:518 length:375 start_codon:yes stop_codon:yes gene_type:complete